MPSSFSSRAATSVTIGAGSGSAAGGAISTFGEVLSVSPHATAQGDFIYGINDRIFTSGAYGSSAISEDDTLAVLSSGTDLNSYSFLRTSRTVRYRPGQGSLIKITAIFDNGLEGTTQLAGAGNRSNGYYFGYSGSSFGILHDENGKRAIQKLSITDNNAVAVTASIVVNGTTASVPLLAGNSSSLANQIEKFNWFNFGPDGGWEAMAIGADVLLIANNQYEATGSFSVSGLTASFSTKVSGSDTINTFISQSSFNVDTIDGNGPSLFNINPQKGNVYQIGFQYLGFGNAFFQVENSETGRMTPVHMIKNSNSRTTTVLKNHNVSPRWFAGNTLTSGTPVNVNLKASSCAAFVEGIPNNDLFPQFAINHSSALASTNTLYPFLTLRVNKVHKENKDCYSQIILQKLSLAAAAASGKFTKLFIYKNATLSNDAVFRYLDPLRSISSYDLNATSLTGGSLIYSTAISAGGTILDNLVDYDFSINEGETFTIALLTNDGSANNIPGLSVSWAEEQ
jgi:hypothetical protein